MSPVEKLCLGLSCTAALLSVVSFVICWLNWSRQRFLLSMSSEVKRFARIEESVVRSVMEEGADVSIEAHMRVFERLRKSGMSVFQAADEARKITGRKESD